MHQCAALVFYDKGQFRVQFLFTHQERPIEIKNLFFRGDLAKIDISTDKNIVSNKNKHNLQQDQKNKKRF